MPTRPVTLAIVGATGLAGRAALELLPEGVRDPAERRRLAAGRAREEGERLEYLDDELPVKPVSQSAFQGADVALFFVPPAVAREWAPRAWAEGCAVVDASSAFQADPEVPLVWANALEAADGYRARGLVSVATGPAALLAPVLAPLAREAGLREVVATVLSPAAGAGTPGIVQLETEAGDLMNGREPEPGVAIPHRLAYNVVPQAGSFLPDGRTDEEAAVEIVLRRLLGAPALRAATTTLRVPVFYGLSVAARVGLQRPLAADAVRAALRGAPGVKLVDDPGARVYPMPMLSMNDDAVLAGRVRVDEAAQAVDLVGTADDLRHAVGTALRAAERIAAARG
jgi:aspartate-semialdehyde dehydrogenase